MAAQPTEIEAKPLGSIESQRRYFNRELSWLAFNDRVLEEACNPRHPLLERLRFLSISASNLDEFNMVRVAGLRQQVRAGIASPSQDGLAPEQQLARIFESTTRLMDEQVRIWGALRREMRQQGLAVLDMSELDGSDNIRVILRFFAGVQYGIGSDVVLYS